MTLRKSFKRFFAASATLMLAIANHVEVEASCVEARRRRELSGMFTDLAVKLEPIFRRATTAPIAGNSIPFADLFRDGQCTQPGPCDGCRTQCRADEPDSVDGSPNVPDIGASCASDVGAPAGVQDDELDGPVDGDSQSADLEAMFAVLSASGAKTMPSYSEMAQAWVKQSQAAAKSNVVKFSSGEPA